MFAARLLQHCLAHPELINGQNGHCSQASLDKDYGLTQGEAGMQIPAPQAKKQAPPVAVVGLKHCELVVQVCFIWKTAERAAKDHTRLVYQGHERAPVNSLVFISTGRHSNCNKVGSVGHCITMRDRGPALV